MINQERVQMIVAKILQEKNDKNQYNVSDLPINETIINIRKAHEHYQTFSLKKQLSIITGLRTIWHENSDSLIAASSEIHMGTISDKKELLTHLLDNTFDIRDIESKSITGDNGLTLIDYSSYGIFAIALPQKLAIETMINQVISLLSAGNGGLFFVEPTQYEKVKLVKSLVAYFLDDYQIENLLEIAPFSDHNWQQAINHPDISAVMGEQNRLLSNQHALIQKKMFIHDGAPVPVIVDETADLKRAAQDIVSGAEFDQNLLFCAEKFLIVTEAAYDYFCHALDVAGTISDKVYKNRLLSHDFIASHHYGKTLALLEKSLNMLPSNRRIALIALQEDELAKQSFHQYSGLPILFILKARGVEHAIEIALKIDGKAHFMAIMHSKNIDYLSLCARKMQTSIFVKNAPSTAALGMGGEGFPSMFVANVTGEGPLHPKDYARKRRCVLAEGFLIR